LPKANRRRGKRFNSTSLVKEWYLVGLALVGAASVGAGAFDWEAGGPWYSLVLGGVVTLAGLNSAWKSLRNLPAGSRLANAVEGPLIWTVLAWMIYRFAGPFRTHFFVLPAGYLAWLGVVVETPVIIAAALLAFAMELVLTILGRQDLWTLILNLSVCGVLFGALRLFAGSERFRLDLRARLEKQRVAAANEKLVRDLDVYKDKKTIHETLPPFAEFLKAGDGSQQSFLSKIVPSFDAQLELIRQALVLNTVALLWPDDESRELHLRSVATIRNDLMPGPYQMGDGITGAFRRDINELVLAPVKREFSGLPYYPSNKGVGAIYAARIGRSEGPENGDQQRKPLGLLLADRKLDSNWSEEELVFFRHAAWKIGLDVEMAMAYQVLKHEHSAFQRVCVGLRELNQALGLDSVLEAATRAVMTLVPADFLAISLLEENEHRIVKVQGNRAEKLLGMKFAVDDGLVGQVIRLGCILPAGARYPGPAPVFSDEEVLAGYGSLLVMPLRKEDSTIVGALTVATVQPGVLAESHREVLSLIADQVAVKIELGQAHEQINRLATTDGLTGLANHRSFQHGLSVMLDRAARQEMPLCLILCDIDYFKKINDTYGHPFGDWVLKGVAGVLRGSVRKIDLASRYGGEEFAIVLENSPVVGGLRMAERMRREVENLVFKHETGEVRVSMSFGIASFPLDGEQQEVIISRADKALYHSKESGRNRSTAWADLSGDEKDMAE